MIFTLEQASPAGGGTIALRCPACRQMGTFAPLDNQVDLLVPNHRVFLGQRRCPNTTCNAHVFAAWEIDGRKVLISYPAQRIDFDASQIPAPVAEALEEAITCHADGCFIAAGIMVRKTLEELCDDRQAKGKNLQDRIADLGTKLVLPKELLDGLDALRLLGNDAAHIESKTFNQVGQEEVELAVDVTKEVLKAVYQYQSLVERLHALKKS